MEDREPPKPRRPLPTPNDSASRPSTPVMGVPDTNPVPPSKFYGSNSSGKRVSNPPPLPSRNQSIGSSHTKYLPPPTPPPTYQSADTSPYREPELVTDDLISNTRDTSRLAPRPSTGQWYDGPDHWTPSTSAASWVDQSTTWSSKPWSSSDPLTWSGGYDQMDYVATYTTKLVTIDGRDEKEEENWWNPEVVPQINRPGHGMLPPLVADTIHNAEYSLFSVTARPPEIKSSEPSGEASSSISKEAAARSSPTPSIRKRSSSVSSPPPSAEEVRTAVPHPHAYFSPKEHGWLLTISKSSSLLPPLAKSFQNTLHDPLPDQSRRKKTSSCIGDRDQPFGQANRTHHFHRYVKAIDSRQLNPPYHRNVWEKAVKLKQKRREMSINMEDLDLESIKNIDKLEEIPANEDEGDLLDLYVCCQCSVYCVASGIIPGVIPRKYFDDFVREKREHPPVGKTGDAAVIVAVETLVKIIQDKLWLNETRSLPVMSKTFQKRLAWSPAVQKIFEILGFTQSESTGSLVLSPPSTDIKSPDGALNRAKWLRCWVEINAWTEYQRMRVIKSTTPDIPAKTPIEIDSFREFLQRAIGSHPEQIPRSVIPASLIGHPGLETAWKTLGLTSTSFSPDVLGFAYMAQCRCDPLNTVTYFTHFFAIVNTLQEFGDSQTDLQSVLLEERSRGRYTYEDQEAASRTLGFGHSGNLGVEFEQDVPEDFIVNAWKECVKRAWKDPTDRGSTLQHSANEGLRILAEARGSLKLRKLWESAQGSSMTPDKAYDTLEVPKDVDEDMLLTVYMMRVEEQPNQVEKMKEALSIIAEVRDSSRLRHFLETGMDPNDITVPIRPDLPRGLNQLGNTCYLNSLLQYFYTIKELREAVAPMASLDLKSLDDKLTDDDLKRHRVGGRLVTRREISRSKKFISHLADLFHNLEFCEAAAVTPSIELAKLALVTSKDEEEDEVDKGGTDSSNDTDATLVDDGPSRFPRSDSPLDSQPAISSSILGKRPRDIERQQSAMDVDAAGTKEPVVSPRQSGSPSLTPEAGSSSKVPESSNHKDPDVEMLSTVPTHEPPVQRPPPLPPRKTAPASDSVMMFGKQHDVSECMDNCMFQIETALLKFDAMSESQNSDKTSVVKRLFYGKIRQRLAIASSDHKSRSSMHEKEDLFSHLPMNVANDGVDLYDGLSGYFDDTVEFEGKKARMEVSLVDLPPLLQIQLQRVQFNRETLQPYKSQAYVKFGETIYMDRFMDGADPQKKAQSKLIQADLTACRERIHLLTQSKNSPFDSAFTNTIDFLRQVEGIELPDADYGLLSHLQDEEKCVQAEIEEFRLRASKFKEDLESIWKGDCEAAYELTSVFIHRGTSPSWGHYFFYSRHLPEKPDSWFKYNDSDVSVVPKDEVLADTTGSTANPYLLVFARKGAEVVETVKRFDPAIAESVKMKTD